MKQCKRLEQLLQRKSGATSMEIIEAIKSTSPHSRLSELKNKGWVIRLMRFCEAYDPLMHACDETLHARPDRKAPEDEAIKLVEVISTATNTVERALKALDHLKARGGIRAVA